MPRLSLFLGALAVAWAASPSMADGNTRTALYEVMRFTDPLKELVLQGSSAAELKAGAIKQGMISLRMAGILKVMNGTTTPEEVLRVTMAD